MPSNRAGVSSSTNSGTQQTERMPRLLLATDGPVGARFALVELARRLRGAGHQVVVSGTLELRTLAERHDFDFKSLPDNHTTEVRLSDSQRSRVERFRSLAERRKAVWRAAGIEAWAALLEEAAPDLLLIDGEMAEHVLMAASRDVPLITLNTFASIWRAIDTPPPHTSIRPGAGAWGTRPGIALAWWLYGIRKRWMNLHLWWRHAGCDRRSILEHAANDLGIDLARISDGSHWLKPWVWTAFPALSLHASEFEFSSALAQVLATRKVCFAGPLLLQERCEAELPAEDRERLDALFAGSAGSAHGERCIIYVGLGSFFSAREDWLRRLFAAVAGRPGWNLLLSLGGRQAPDFLETTDQIHVFRWLPQLEVLGRLQVAVVHGGINTIDECVLAGVPMLVCHGGETDMAGNQARVVYHGLGLVADPATDSPEHIGDSLDRLLQDSTFRRRVEMMAESYRRYEQEQVAEQWIASCLSASLPGRL